MGGDYSRFTFNPKKNYSKILKQQGRVGLDSDSNELEDIADRRFRAETLDIMGFNPPNKGWQAKVPSTTPDAFKINLNNNRITIGKGRMYVDGLMAECHGYEKNGNWEYDPALGEKHGADEVPFEKQPYYFEPQILPVANANYLVYLDVWQREITAIEDPEIKEIALGGADTTTRIQTVWQVKLHEIKSKSSDCSSITEVNSPSAGRMSTVSAGAHVKDSLCEIAAAGGYSSVENRLYRIEIHERGKIDTANPARFKWSKDNGSIAAAVETIESNNPAVLIVKSLGRDQFMRFSENDWVEIIDDKSELESFHGEMARVVHVDEQDRKITLDRNLKNIYDLSKEANRHTRVRKWDQKDETLPVASGPIEIESGIKIEFKLDPTSGDFNAGDYWLFATRTADGSIESFIEAPPKGIIHHYAPLAILGSKDGNWIFQADCRQKWPIDAEQNYCCTIVIRPGDDKATIASAVEKVSKGGVICFIPGEYWLQDSITIKGNSIKIKGCGDSTIIHGPENKPAFIVYEGKSIKLKSMQIKYGLKGIVIENGQLIEITEIKMEGMIKDNSINSKGTGISIRGQDIRITENRLNGGGIWVRDYSDDILINNNKISDGDGPGIKLGGLETGETPSSNETKLSNITIQNNNIFNLKTSGIRTDSASQISSINVYNNRIYRCAQSEKKYPEFGIKISLANDVIIQNNEIYDNRRVSPVFYSSATQEIFERCGIFLDNCGMSEVIGNSVRNNDSGTRSVGICIIGNKKNILINNNLVMNPSVALLVQNIGGDTLVTSNMFSTIDAAMAIGIGGLGLSLLSSVNFQDNIVIYNKNTNDYNPVISLLHANGHLSFENNYVKTKSNYLSVDVILQGNTIISSGNRLKEESVQINSSMYCISKSSGIIVNNIADNCIIAKNNGNTVDPNLINTHNIMKCPGIIVYKEIENTISKEHLTSLNQLLDLQKKHLSELQKLSDEARIKWGPRPIGIERLISETESEIEDLQAMQKRETIRSKLGTEERLIAAKVLDQNSQPIEGLIVQLFDSRDNKMAVDITDKGGNATIVYRKGAVEGLKGIQPQPSLFGWLDKLIRNLVQGSEEMQLQSYLVVNEDDGTLLYDSRKINEKGYNIEWPEYLEIKVEKKPA